VVKRVECGSDTRFMIQNVPHGRHFLVAAVAHINQGAGGAAAAATVRSAWVLASTLRPLPAEETTHGSLSVARDFLGQLRGRCLCCPCRRLRLREGAVHPDAACRACACPATAHERMDIEVVATSAGTRVNMAVPTEARSWEGRELALFVESGGLFHPRAMSARRRSPPSALATGERACRVSVVTPTTESRQAFHEQLWAVFDAQLWPDKELVVVETYRRRRSRFFARKAREDERVIHFPIRVSAEADLSIGLKRNICTHLASGEYIANFDDDDLYAPGYLDTMIRAMREQGNEAVTLGSWFVFDTSAGKFGHVDPKASHGLRDPQQADEWLFGYGFSYIFSRALALENPYPDCDLGEDYAFYAMLRVKNTQKAGVGSGASSEQGAEEKQRKASSAHAGVKAEVDVDPKDAWVQETDEASCAQFYRNSITGEVSWEAPPEFTPQDEEAQVSEPMNEQPCNVEFLDPSGIALHFDSYGICLHTLHAQSTSDSWARREVPQEEADELEVTDLKGIFPSFLHRFPRTSHASRFIQRGRRRCRTLRICTSGGEDMRLQSHAGATAGDVRPLIARRTGFRQEAIELYRGIPAQDAWVPEGPPLTDQDRIGPRTTDLWAVLPV